MHVSVATLECLPGKFAEVREAFAALAEGLKETHPGLKQALILGDEGSGKLQGVGVWDSPEEAVSVYQASEYKSFSENVASLLVGPPESEEYNLYYSFD